MIDWIHCTALCFCYTWLSICLIYILDGTYRFFYIRNEISTYLSNLYRFVNFKEHGDTFQLIVLNLFKSKAYDQSTYLICKHMCIFDRRNILIKTWILKIGEGQTIFLAMFHLRIQWMKRKEEYLILSSALHMKFDTVLYIIIWTFYFQKLKIINFFFVQAKLYF